jgi:UDP-N-acetylglucosamine/UDP-N-acetylgalactosamine diphosphorylase
MAGGTDETNHSEVGSSYVHFNYTPNQDKATASLIGDVPKGVMIKEPPIFLGGQGGLVGPVKIGYGIVVGAGNVVRKDMLEENSILIGQAVPNLSMPFYRGLYTNIRKIISRNINYIANIIALRRWYLNVRSMFMADDPMDKALLRGAVNKLDLAIAERVHRLGQVAEKMPRSMEIYEGLNAGRTQKKTLKSHKAFSERWNEMAQVLQISVETDGEQSQKEAFLEIIEKVQNRYGKNYLKAINGLTKVEASIGTIWLQGLVDQVTKNAMEVLPGLKVGHR